MSACPKCANVRLRHTLVAGSLPANGCHSCGGVLVPLVSYRDWRERSGVAERSPAEAPDASEVSDTKTALVCGQCSRLMTKFRVSPDTDNRIDYCSSCDDIWLDKGEWELIEALVGAGELLNITSEPWQYQVMAEGLERMELQRLKAKLGDDFEKVAEFRKLLKDHPEKTIIMAWLSDSSR